MGLRQKAGRDRLSRRENGRALKRDERQIRAAVQKFKILFPNFQNTAKTQRAEKQLFFFYIQKLDVPPVINNKLAKIGENKQVLMQQLIKVDVDQVDC